MEEKQMKNQAPTSVKVVSFGIQFISVLYVVLGLSALVAFVLGLEFLGFGVYLVRVLPVTFFGFELELGLFGGPTSYGAFTFLSLTALALGIFMFIVGARLRKMNTWAFVAYTIVNLILFAGMAMDGRLFSSSGEVGQLADDFWSNILLVIFAASVAFLWYAFWRYKKLLVANGQYE